MDYTKERALLEKHKLIANIRYFLSDMRVDLAGLALRLAIHRVTTGELLLDLSEDEDLYRLRDSLDSFYASMSTIVSLLDSIDEEVNNLYDIRFSELKDKYNGPE